ncbi:MAG: 50S ribosomal protein L4 [Spirochaetaceae bacterium]|jgi:large subunit ribosomal protein L4|nr:50S ribosomal protein L4 [Spirochaetaceae bacterium]
METAVYSTAGQELRKIELDDAVFGLDINEDVLWYAINNELANKRVGTACTKDRGEVHGSNAKPYKQKGTGRARRGDKKSPLLVGGGTVFGPKPRDFSYKMPKMEKRLAIKTALSLKAHTDTLKVIEDFDVENGKTKNLFEILNNFGSRERTVIVLNDNEKDRERISLLKRAGRNIPWLSFLSSSRLRVHDLFYGRRVFIMETAVNEISEFYAIHQSRRSTVGEAQA